MTTTTRYAVLYRNQDGTFSTGQYVHRFPMCPVASIKPDETRDVVGVVQIHAPFDQEAGLLNAQDYRAAHADRIDELHRQLAREQKPTGIPHLLFTAHAASVGTMVNRFLGWRLPQDFAPDAGVSFIPPTLEHAWPTGTNLMTAQQARAMFEHCAAPGADNAAGQCLEQLREILDARAVELANRLCASGPKAAHVSASECHEIRDAIVEAAALLAKASGAQA